MKLKHNLNVTPIYPNTNVCYSIGNDGDPTTLDLEEFYLEIRLQQPVLKMVKKVTFPLFIAIALFGLWGHPPLTQAQDNIPLAPAFILLTAQASTQPEIAQIQALIKAKGGQETHIFPHQALVANIPAHTIQLLTALPSVAAVFTQPVELAHMDIYGPKARNFANVWNNLIAPKSAPTTMDLAATEHPADHNDAFVAPDLPDKIGIASNSSITPGYYQTSEFMTGSVAVGIVLVESNGSTDPSTEDWTDDEKQLVFSEIVAALNWWTEREPRAKLSFVYDDHFSTPLPTSVEPITRPYAHQQYWINDAMSALGYGTSSYFSRVRNYNNTLRETYQTDWAFTIFVVDSSVDSDNRFSDSFFAYAYLGGPFMVMTSGNNGYGAYNIDAVAAHEIGHIFYALDQYATAYRHCTNRSGYLNVENQNSQYGGCASNVTSIMRGQTNPYQSQSIDPYATGQIGWRDSDSDNILDPLDTELPISIDTISQNGNNITVSGTTNIVPYPSPSHTSVTINTLTGVQYRFNEGDWQQAVAEDGGFNSTVENYHFTAASLLPGRHTLAVAALDSAGNVSQGYATETITIFDPIDGGLNTEFNPWGGSIIANQSSTISGEAYHLQSGVVTGVEYRIDGGSWQSAKAQDGTFDSNYESFTVSIDALEPGTYFIEAQATDGDGNVEVNGASQQFEITKPYTIVLPLVIKG